MSMRATKDSIWPYGRIAWHYEYRDYDHDEGEKDFLGRKGNFNGDEIIDIIVQERATAEFISTRLFQYFAADELSDKSEAVIEEMIKAYFESGYEIASVLRTLFNSDFFKTEGARYARVKGPVESIVGTARMAGSYQEPTLEINSLWAQTLFMGQGLLAPPTVEGWHEGVEWVDSGALVERVNFAAKELGDPSKPGVKDIIKRLKKTYGNVLSAEQVVDGCLDLIGPLNVDKSTREGLVDFVYENNSETVLEDAAESHGSTVIARTLSMIASTKEYQLA